MNDLLGGQASTEHISTSSVTLNTGVVTDMSNDADINSSSALLDSAEAQHPHQQVDLIAPSQLVLQGSAGDLGAFENQDSGVGGTPRHAAFGKVPGLGFGRSGDTRGLDDRTTPGEGLKDRWVHTTILELIALVGPLQMRMHASASQNSGAGQIVLMHRLQRL